MKALGGKQMNESNLSKSPAVSVLMSVYNTEEAFLREAIESVLNQTFGDFEFIIVLDGPTDNSPAIVRSYHDPRIIILDNVRNLGISKSWNKALAVARGKYIAKTAADDVYLPWRLEKQFSYMEAHPDADVLDAGVLCFGDVEPQQAYPSHEDDNDVIKARMLFFNAGAIDTTVCIRRSFLEKHAIRFDESFLYSSDYKFWYDVAWAGGRMHSLQETLAKYRIHKAQITSKLEREAVHGTGNDYAVRLICEQLERLLGPIDDHVFAVHNAIYMVDMDISVEECDAHITRLLEANRQKKLYEPKSFRKVILSIWLLTELRMLRRHRSTKALKSKYLLPSLAPSVVFHTAKWKLLDKGIFVSRRAN